MLFDFEAATWHHYICEAILSSMPEDTNCGDLFGIGEDACAFELYSFSEHAYVTFEKLYALNYRYDEGVPLYELPEKLAELFWSKFSPESDDIPTIDVDDIRELFVSLMQAPWSNDKEVSTSIMMNVVEQQYRVLEISINHLTTQCLSKLGLSLDNTNIIKVEDGYLINLTKIDNISELPVSDIVKELVKNAKLAGFKMVNFNKNGHEFDHLLKF